VGCNICKSVTRCNCTVANFPPICSTNNSGSDYSWQGIANGTSSSSFTVADNQLVTFNATAPLEITSTTGRTVNIRIVPSNTPSDVLTTLPGNAVGWSQPTGTSPGTCNPLADVSISDTACGVSIEYLDCNGQSFEPKKIFNVGIRAVKTSPVAIPGAVIGKVAAVKIDPVSGNITLAQADALDNIADFIVLVVSNTQVAILNQGVHSIPAHGISPINYWYALSRTVAGGFAVATTYNIDGIIQNALYVLSPDCIYVQLEEAIPACDTCDLITITAHGYTLPTSGVIPIGHNGTTWVKAIADGVGPTAKLLVTEIIDANTVRVAHAGILKRTAHGLTIGQDYSLSQSVAGEIVLTSTISSGINQKLLTAISTNCVTIC
jgi:hypothetical protein